MSAPKPPCPRCGANLENKALVDSEDRVWQQWRYCAKAGCGYDQRYAAAEPEVREFKNLAGKDRAMLMKPGRFPDYR